MKSIRILALSGLAAVSAISMAQTFAAVSEGTYATGGLGYSTSETVLSSIDSYAVPATLSFAAVYGGMGISSGIATYDDGGGNTLTLSITGGGPFYFDAGVTTSSIAGTWSFVSGTGAYSAIASGDGTWSASYSALAGSYATTAFVGNFTPVPEPATMAVLAAGALAMARRRRKA